MNRLFIRLTNKVASVRDADDNGGVAAEYGVLLAGIVAVVALAAAALGGRIGSLFNSILPSSFAVWLAVFCAAGQTTGESPRLNLRW